MQELFANFDRIPIGAKDPNTIQSTLSVSGMTGSVSNVVLAVAIDHSFVSDLVLVLTAPSGKQVVLADAVGGGADDIRARFSDASPIGIKSGAAPFVGTFRPEQAFSTLAGTAPNGDWRLTVVDEQWADGGELSGWALMLTTSETSRHQIEVVFGSGLTDSQKQAFTTAAAFWEALIQESAPPVTVGGKSIKGVRIDASGIHIDGPNGILGQAGPVAIRPDTMIPATGMMQFDTGDLATMELHGNLTDVIIHEMGHVLGIGTLWKNKLLLKGAGTANPTFTGPKAMAEYATLAGLNKPTPVPVENTGGPGTREGHWRESVFANELMTGFVDTGENPLSLLTAASLVDFGYRVNMDVAEAFTLPSSLQMAMMGVGADPTFQHCCTLDHHGRHPGVVPLPHDSLED
jgi:subtilisin-like proprotein convertase family protein